MGLYVGIHPLDGRIRFVCDSCHIDKIALTYAEAKRDARAHKQAFHEQRNAA